MLSAVAGFVDAVAFVELGGFSVSFMSGNSTRLGVGLFEDGGAARLAASLIAAFVSGVIAGSVAGRAAGKHQRPAVLAMVTVILALAALAGLYEQRTAAVLLLAIAMGAENAVFEQDGEARIGLTYMTGALVKLGQRLAAALRGGPAWAWTPYALLWACFGPALWRAHASAPRPTPPGVFMRSGRRPSPAAAWAPPRSSSDRIGRNEGAAAVRRPPPPGGPRGRRFRFAGPGSRQNVRPTPTDTTQGSRSTSLSSAPPLMRASVLNHTFLTSRFRLQGPRRPMSAPTWAA